MTEKMLIQRWKHFIKTDASAGIVLVTSAALALFMANSFLSYYYNDFLDFPVSITLGNFAISKPLVLWINDGLMALFFFVVGLEIKRELFYGQLSKPDQIVLPFLAAVAGIAVPALIYAAFNYQDAVALGGWAIPSATDIAFALGIFVMFGKHLPPSLKLFLLSVAIIDDIGAVIIIALFYSENLAPFSLIVASVGLVVLFIFNRLGLENKSPFILVSIVVWAAVLKSGVHATLAGFAVAWFIPMARDHAKSMAYQLEHGMHPWITFFVLPLFAFANAGVGLTNVGVDQLFTPITIGIIVGLFVGKQLGIFTACWLAIKLKLCKLPKDANWQQLYGVCVLCGVGFTMSLFIGALAFEQQGREYQTQVKVGVLVGSILSAVFGAWLLSRASKKLPQSKGESNENVQTAKA
ncbi:Na+/H+ antiporter NhaA [Colwellia sp. MEBiC06753]